MMNQDEQTDSDIESVQSIESENEVMLDDENALRHNNENYDDLTHSCFLLTLFLCSFCSFIYGTTINKC